MKKKKSTTHSSFPTSNHTCTSHITIKNISHEFFILMLHIWHEFFFSGFENSICRRFCYSYTISYNILLYACTLKNILKLVPLANISTQPGGEKKNYEITRQHSILCILFPVLSLQMLEHSINHLMQKLMHTTVENAT